MPTTAEHLAARSDADLRARLMASAEQAGIKDAEAWVSAHIGELITSPVSGDTTITSAYGYAMNVRNEKVAALPPAPGLDPGAVTDSHLSAAVAAVMAAA